LEATQVLLRRIFAIMADAGGPVLTLGEKAPVVELLHAA
jgi:hypothetical protein